MTRLPIIEVIEFPLNDGGFRETYDLGGVRWVARGCTRREFNRLVEQLRLEYRARGTRVRIRRVEFRRPSDGHRMLQIVVLEAPKE